MLHDTAGRYHLAHFAGEIPLLWEELLGEPPGYGSSLLTAFTGGVYRASFESINLRSRLPLGIAQEPSPSSP